MFSRRRALQTLTLAAASRATASLGKTRETGEKGRDDTGAQGLVSLLRDTPRKKLLEALVERIRRGLDYEPLLGAVAEAAAREVSPYPVVGFKYHAFMVMQAVHLNTLHGRPSDRWLPVLWAADLFKTAQAQDDRETGWRMGPVPAEAKAGPGRAEVAFDQAVRRWDPEAADAAVVALVQALPLEAVFERLFRFAARDFRFIGHKAITAANCHRLIRVLGRGQAVPMLRSLTYAIQNHGEGANPADADFPADRPWRRNLERLRSLPKDWSSRSAAFDPVPELLPVMREGSAAEAADEVVAMMERGAGPARIWQALFAAAGELLLRRAGIIAVHANTTCNALHYAYRQVEDERTRALLLLQAAAFLPMFRSLMSADTQRPLTIGGLAPLQPQQSGAPAVAEIFAELSTDRLRAARKSLGYLSSGGPEAPFMESARHYTVTRNMGFHDYKLTEAAFENARYLSPPWRERYLAASALYFNGSGDRRNPAVSEARNLLGEPARL